MRLKQLLFSSQNLPRGQETRAKLAKPGQTPPLHFLNGTSACRFRTCKTEDLGKISVVRDLILIMDQKKREKKEEKKGPETRRGKAGLPIRRVNKEPGLRLHELHNVYARAGAVRFEVTGPSDLPVPDLGQWGRNLGLLGRFSRQQWSSGCYYTRMVADSVWLGISFFHRSRLGSN